MPDWFRNNALFVFLGAVLVAAILLAMNVGDKLQDNLLSEPLEIRVENPLKPMSAFDLKTGEELLLDYSSEQTILFVLRGQDLTRQDTLSFWNSISDSQRSGTRVYGLLGIPSDHAPSAIDAHFRLLSLSRKDQLLGNGIVGTPMTIAVRAGGALKGFWIGHPNAEKRREILSKLERWGFLGPTENERKGAGA